MNRIHIANSYDDAKAVRRAIKNPWLAEALDRVFAYSAPGTSRQEFIITVNEYVAFFDYCKPFRCECGGEVHIKASVGLYKCTGCGSLWRQDRELLTDNRPHVHTAECTHVPAPRSSDDTPQAVVGIYEYEGELFAVRPSKTNPDRTVALRIIVAPSNRMNQDGAISKLTFERAKGMVYRLKEEHRLTHARAEELSIQYGNCICCGKGLKVAESVKRGIGPVCAKKYFVS